MSDLKKMSETWAKTFLAAALATYLAVGLDVNAIANAAIASVLGSIGLLIAGLRYIIKLENLPLISRLDKLESTLELALREKVAKGGTRKARR